MNEIKVLESEINSSKQDFREDILSFEDKFSKVPGTMVGDFCPIKHTFAGGIYVREMHCPKEHLVVTKIHKLDHPYFVLKGEVSVLTENGFKRIKAPFSGITKAGTKRICFTHEDTIWTTIHIVGEERNLEKIEDDVIAKTFDEVKESINFDGAWFRELTKIVIKAEKHGFWSDWTEEQQKLYSSGDWEAFSRSRGYSEIEIFNFKEWLNIFEYGKSIGINPTKYIDDLVTDAAISNLKKDSNNEIELSSHIPILKKDGD